MDWGLRLGGPHTMMCQGYLRYRNTWIFLVFKPMLLTALRLCSSMRGLRLPTVYGFFALTFVVFYVAASGSVDRTLIDKSFYVWVSVFSLLHISVFWSFMSDLFNKEQAGRLFGIIAAGASVGGLIGPAIPSFFSSFGQRYCLVA